MQTLTECDALAARERLADGCVKMKSLLVGLLDSQGRVADEVHAIRKLGKSLRGGFTLFGLEKCAAREIQAIGRLLSGPRDAVSRLNTWKRLDWSADPRLAAAVAGLLEIQVHSAARRPPGETIDWCLDRVNTALSRLHDIGPEQLADGITRGLTKLAKRIAKRCRRLSQRDDSDFHEARKALKAWLGAVGFLPDGAAEIDPLLSETAAMLGDENDLATLSAWLLDHGFTERFAPDLWKHLNHSRKSLQRKATKDAARFTRRK